MAIPPRRRWEQLGSCEPHGQLPEHGFSRSLGLATVSLPQLSAPMATSNPTAGRAGAPCPLRPRWGLFHPDERRSQTGAVT